MRGRPARSPLPTIGELLNGKYRIERLLGEGGMAFVFEAQHVRLGHRVAVKLLAPELSRDVELVHRFEREARAVARLSTRHVPRVLDVDVTDRGLPYIVMEFLEGRDLEGELEARGALPLEEVVDDVLQACAAMDEAHAAGIIHRDLKPANLFVTSGAERVVKVLDFGISKVLGEATKLTAAGAVFGTVLYMSPEQVRASADVDARADVWSLGVILFELVAGRPPWTGSSAEIGSAILSKDAPDLRAFARVPDAFAGAVAAMLRRDRAQRLATVRDVAAALAPFAPPRSLGAACAEALAPRSTPRAPAPTSSQKYTVRMDGAPPPPPSSRDDLAPYPAAVAPPASPAPRRWLVVLAVVAGFLVTLAVGLGIFAAMRARAQAVPAPASTR